jgi:outer membrane immunogenic protein
MFPHHSSEDVLSIVRGLCFDKSNHNGGAHMLSKSLLVVVTMAAALAGTQLAGAADLPVKAPPMVAPAWSWSGWYVGINGGFGGNETTYPFSAPTLGTTGQGSLTSSGFFAGGQVGYNWQWSQNWLFGIEADLQWANIEAKLAANAATPVGGLTFSAGTEVNWFGTVRGRIGYIPWDRTLIYGTGGFAYGNTTTRLNVSAPGLAVGFSQDNSQTGWTAGAGLEIAVLPNVSFKTEYLYVDLGKATVFNGVAFGVLPLTVSENTTFHTVKAGLNWRFATR